MCDPARQHGWRRTFRKLSALSYTYYSRIERHEALYRLPCETCNRRLPVEHLPDNPGDLLLRQRLHGEGPDACGSGRLRIHEMAESRAHDDGQVGPDGERLPRSHRRLSRAW